MSKCSIAGVAKSGGGAAGDGKLIGSYFWYVWMMPPSWSRVFIGLARSPKDSLRSRRRNSTEDAEKVSTA